MKDTINLDVDPDFEQLATQPVMLLSGTEGADNETSHGISRSPKNETESWAIKKSKTSWVDEKVNKNKQQEEQVKLTWLQVFVRSGVFNVATTGMICVNGILMGIETDWGDGSFGWKVSELLFLIFYTVELMVRLRADGVKLLKTDHWVQFDFGVVMIAYVDMCILGPLLSESGEAKQLAMLLRIFRLLKLTRIVRLLRFFKELWLLVASFGSAFKTLTWTFILLLIIIYVFAILFVKMVGVEADSEDIKVWFGTVGAAMFTLFTVVTLADDWVEIARTVWDTDRWFMTFVIIFFMMICSFAVLNTVMAVIVEHTLGEAMDHKDEIVKKANEELHRTAQQLVVIFRSADEDDNDTLSKDEFIKALRDPNTRKILQEMDLGEEFGCLDAEEIGVLFETMDVDDSRGLKPQEFVEGMMQMRGPARAKRLFEMHCDILKKLRRSDQNVALLLSKVSELEFQLCKQGEAAPAADRSVAALDKKTNEQYKALCLQNQALQERLDLLFGDLSVREIEQPSVSNAGFRRSLCDSSQNMRLFMPGGAGPERALTVIEEKVAKQHQDLCQQNHSLHKRLDLLCQQNQSLHERLDLLFPSSGNNGTHNDKAIGS